MTSSPVRDRTWRARRELLCRTALCGALAGFVATATPALALPQQADANPTYSNGGSAPVITLPTDTQMTVALSAQRTVIEWNTYNVNSNETVAYTFGARNWIVLNRIDDTGTPPTISGTISGTVNGAYGGNIWFASPSGMIFGPTAQIDAGGLLISTAAPNLTSFLCPNNLTFTFPGTEVDEGATITMQTGASINGHGGLVAIIAPSIVTQAGTTVTGQNGSSVLYGATNGFTLTLSQNAPGDFDLVDFVIPGSSSGSDAAVMMDLQNTTTANSVFVAAVSRAQTTSAVINLEGMITAQGATADGGDIILSGGGGIMAREIGPAVGGTNTDFYLQTLSAARDIQLQTSGQVFGSAYIRSTNTGNGNGNGCANGNGYGNGGETNGFGGNNNNGGGERLLGGTHHRTLRSAVDDTQISDLTAGRDIFLVASENISLGTASAGRSLTLDGLVLQANSLSADGSVTLTSEGGAVNVGSLSVSGGGAVNSSGSVEIDSVSAGSSLNIQAAASIQLGDGSGSASGAVTLTAGGDINANLSSASITSVNAGGQADLQGGSLSVGTVSATEVTISGSSVSVTRAISSGDVAVSATSGSASVVSASAGGNISVSATGGTASLTSATLSGGQVTVQSSDGNAMLGLGTGTVTGAAAVGVMAGQDAIVQVPTALPAMLTINAGRDATLSAPSVTFNAVQAGRDVTLNATAGNFSDTSPITATRNLTIGATGTLTVGNITATSGTVSLTGATVTTGVVDAGQSLMLNAGGGSGALTAGNLTATAGSITLTGATITTGVADAGQNVTMSALNGAVAGALTAGNITGASGAVALTASTITAGAVVAGQDLTLKAEGGGVTLTGFQAGQDLTVQGSTLSLGQATGPIGGNLTVTTAGDFTSSNALSVGGTATLNIGGMANLKGLTTPGAVDIVANDITLTGTLSGSNVQIESASGPLQIGGTTAPSSGMWLDNTEFGFIHATGMVNLYAGPTAGTARGDLTIMDLDINPQSTPQVNFMAGSANNVLVEGLVAPTASGGIVHIGDNANAAWQPDSILVSGELGAATYSGGAYSNVRSFNDLRLFATQDIIIGSQRFISLIQGTADTAIDVGRNQPAGVEPTASEQDRVLIAAGDLELSASDKVVSQNTAPNNIQSVGIFLTGAVTPDLIIDPPQVVDLYGAFIGQTGAVVSSFSAGSGVAYTIVDSSGNPTTAPPGAVYRFDSCMIGTNQCSAASAVTSNLAQNTPVLTTTSTASDALSSDSSGDSSDSGDSSSGGGTTTSSGKAGSKANDRNSGPSILSIAPVEADQVLSDPVVTGAGSEELWRKHDNGAKAPDPGAKP